MFLTLTNFLAYFPCIDVTKEAFVKQFIVTYSGRPTLEDLFNFKSVIKNEQDPRYINRDQIIDYFYDIVVTRRHHYLTEFYRSYFSVPDCYDLKWDGVNILTPVEASFSLPTWPFYQRDPAPHRRQPRAEFNQLLEQPLPGLSLQKNDSSRKIIRNLNYLDILHHTRITNTCKSKTSLWQTLINVYTQLELEDRFFAPSSIGLFLRDGSYNNFFYLIQQYQPKASILNPYTVNWILKHILTGQKLLTPVLSWNSYLLAFMHSDFEHYVGIDVLQSVCDRSQFLFDHYQTTLRAATAPHELARLDRKTHRVYCQPSESLLHDHTFMCLYANYFDAILMSPPYFDMEIYPSGAHPQQSIELYPTYQEWLVQYWEATVQLCYHVLAPGRRFGFIVNNYVSLKRDEYPLIQDLNVIALKYFKLIGAYNLLNRVSPLRVNKKSRTEQLFVYQKPIQLKHKICIKPRS